MTMMKFGGLSVLQVVCHRSIIAGILLGMGAEIDTSAEYRKYYEMFRHYI